MILFTIFGSPIPWKRVGINTKTGHVYDQQSKERESYRWQIAAQVEKTPLLGPLEIDIVFYMDIPKKTSKVKKQQMIAGMMHHMHKPDIDNLLKWSLDCMTGLVYEDDSQIWKLSAYKLYGDTPRTAICVRPLAVGKQKESGFSDDSN
jgi:Holliday junction resolvase RusA-like endonuclease